jgi:chromosome segregation ATPase
MNTKEEMYVDKLEESNIELKKEIEILKSENRYLVQRLRELRHKSWFPVYKENLELQEQNKNLDETCTEVIAEYAKLEKEIEQYKSVLASVEKFIGQYSKEKKGDKGCH